MDSAGKKTSLNLKAKKIRAMHTGEEKQNTTIKVNDVQLDQVKDFKYLGSINQTTGPAQKMLRKRISMTKEKMISLSKMLKDKIIPLNLKLNIVKNLKGLLLI